MQSPHAENALKTLRRLDVIVPIYKNAALVSVCVRSLIEHLDEVTAHNPRLVLINDSPDDEDIEELLLGFQSLGRDILVVRNDVNLGFVRSVNHGLTLARNEGRDVLLINSDTQTFPGTLAELLRVARADPQIGFACPRSNNASICSLPHFFGGALPTPEQSYQRWMQISRTMPAYHFAPTAVGFYMFISHAVLANHGGLSENFGLGYEEENDLVMRAGVLGTRAVIANHAFAYHAGSASFKLKDFDLVAHKRRNLEMLSEDHMHFLPLIRRYEDSPHFRAERLLAGLLEEPDGPIKVVFDLSGMGQHYNGTNEQAVAVLRSMASRQGHRIRLTGVASEASFRAHGLDKVEGLYRESPGALGLHAIAVRMAQPFEMDHINKPESLAPINVFAMLDTIAEDCGPLALNGNFLDLWDHVAEHANGLFFISRFSEQTFCNRHPAARALPRWTRLLPTRLSSYPKRPAASQGSHVLVLGNHYPHKGADLAARAIAAAFPTLRIVVLGAETRQSSNVTFYRAGELEPALVESFFTDASIVVLPSHMEGFGFGFMHALSAGRPIVARRIPATEEILASLDEVHGIFQFEDSAGLVRACADALRATVSRAKDDRGCSWDDWADGLTDFCLSLAARDDIFQRLVGRIRAADRLRGAASSAQPARPPGTAKAVDLESLLALDGRAFVEQAYTTLLERPADKSGLTNYLSQLELGTPKVELLHALASSDEGRARNVDLPGLNRMVVQLRKAQMPLLKRIFHPRVTL
jgi:GT2 family glycosyltransferase